jgi:hypothetical protein
VAQNLAAAGGGEIGMNLDLEVPEFCEEWLGGAIRRLCVFSFSFVLCPLLVLETDGLYAYLIVIKVIHQDAFALYMCSQSLSSRPVET